MTAEGRERLYRELWRSRGFLLALALAGLIVGAAFLLLVLAEVRENRALDEYGRVATAEVIQVNTNQKGGHLRVRYTTATGQPAEATMGDDEPDPLPQVGDTIPIVYNPRDPGADVRYQHAGPEPFPWLLAIVGGAMPLLTVGVAASMWRHADHWAFTRPGR